MSSWTGEPVVSSATLVLVALFFVVALVLDAAHRWRYRRYTTSMSGPPCLPFVGNGLWFLGKNTSQIVEVLGDLFEKYESPFRFWMGPLLFIVLDNPEDLQIVVTSSKSLAKHNSYYFFQATRNSIFSAEVSKWKQSRRIINGVFTTKYLNSFIPAFNRLNQDFLKRINRFSGKGQFEAGEYFMGLTLAIICETAMGYDSDSIEDPHNNELLKIFRWLISIDYSRIYKIWQHNDFIYERLFEDKTTKRYRKVIFELMSEVIQKRKQFWKEEEERIKDLDVKDMPELNNFLDIMLRTVDEKHLTDGYLQAETLVMIIGGAETSALTDAFCCLLLAAHPDIQEKAQREVDELFGDGNCHDVGPEKIDQLKYIEQVIKETLRRFCVAPIYLRQSTTDLKLSTCTVPAGAAIAIGAQAMHMNPKYYPDPFKVDPDRWTPEEEGKRNKYSFMAFSGGPRGCIGAKFGMRSVKLTIALVLRHFNVKTDIDLDKLKLKAELLLHSADGYHMSFENRKVCPCPLSH